MKSVEQFAALFDLSEEFILRQLSDYNKLVDGGPGLSQTEWAEYREKARRMHDSVMMRLIDREDLYEYESPDSKEAEVNKLVYALKWCREMLVDKGLWGGNMINIKIDEIIKPYY